MGESGGRAGGGEGGGGEGGGGDGAVTKTHDTVAPVTCSTGALSATVRSCVEVLRRFCAADDAEA